MALALALVLSCESAAAGELEDERAGCLVRTLTRDGKRGVSVSAECRWPVAAEQVISVLRSPECLEEVLSAVGENRALPDGRLFQVHTPGWPFADRQVTLEWREHYQGPEGRLRIDFSRASEQEPVAEGRVPVPVDEGRWEVEALAEHETALRYQVRYDAGGNLDPWLVERFQRGAVIRSLEEVRSRSETLPAVSTAPSTPPTDEAADPID